MKMIKEHFDYLADKLERTLEDMGGAREVVAIYETGLFPRSESVKDLQKRFCFDVLHKARITTWVCDRLYPYLDDDHIYTALKRILPTVTRKY